MPSLGTHTVRQRSHRQVRQRVESNTALRRAPGRSCVSRRCRTSRSWRPHAGCRSLPPAAASLGRSRCRSFPPPPHGPPCRLAGAAAQQRAQVAAVAGEQTGVEAAVGGQARAGATLAERLGDRVDHADLPGAVAVGPARGHLSRSRGGQPLQRPSPLDPREDLARGHHLIQAPPVLSPTSMYSMKRTISGPPRKRSASASTQCSLTPRRTTMLIFTGPRPASRAAAMPSSTRASETASRSSPGTPPHRAYPG